MDEGEDVLAERVLPDDEGNRRLRFRRQVIVCSALRKAKSEVAAAFSGEGSSGNELASGLGVEIEEHPNIECSGRNIELFRDQIVACRPKIAVVIVRIKADGSADRGEVRGRHCGGQGKAEVRAINLGLGSVHRPIDGLETHRVVGADVVVGRHLRIGADAVIVSRVEAFVDENVAARLRRGERARDERCKDHSDPAAI